MEEKKVKKRLKIRKWVPITFCVIIFVVTSVTLFLVFKPGKKYTVTFDTKGGNKISSLTIKGKEKIEEPEHPTKDGYKFLGWYYNNKLYDFDKLVQDDIKLVAKWEKIDTLENEENVEETEEDTKVTGVSLNIKKQTLAKYKTVQLKANIAPANASNKDVTWESSDEKVAIVDVTGKVKGLKEGTTTIKVKTVDGEFEDECIITVVQSVIKVKDINIKGENKVKIGNTIKLSATVSPSNASNKEVTWKSNNPSVASVDSNGNVKGLSLGTASISATADSKTVTYTITVVSEESTPPSGSGNTTPVTPSTNNETDNSNDDNGNNNGNNNGTSTEDKEDTGDNTEPEKEEQENKDKEQEGETDPTPPTENDENDGKTDNGSDEDTSTEE